MKKKLAELINIVFGFRKFLLMLLVYLLGVIFRLKDLINGAEMVDLFKTTTIAFMSANGVEHIIDGVKSAMGKGGASSAPQVADTDESNDEEEVEPAVEG